MICLALRALPTVHGYSSSTAIASSDILMPHIFFQKTNLSMKEQVKAIQQPNKHKHQLDFTNLDNTPWQGIFKVLQQTYFHRRKW